MEANIMAQLDHAAASLHNEKADPNVYEFDYTLWRLLHEAAQHCRNDVIIEFGLQPAIIDLLAKATQAELQQLASGVLISFQSITPDDDVIRGLQSLYDPALMLRSEVSDFDCTYWFLMSRLAQKDLAIAQQVFGVAYPLAHAVSVATDLQLRNMVANIRSSFRLRFSPTVIEEIIDCNTNQVDPTQTLLKKFQQSLRAKPGRRS